MKVPKPPATGGNTKPRNEFGPREALAALDLLSRRQAARLAVLSPVTLLKGGA